MCWFIAAAVPAQPCAVLERLAQGHHVRVTLSPAGDMPAAALFPAGVVLRPGDVRRVLVRTRRA
jgi:hypothetical protein